MDRIVIGKGCSCLTTILPSVSYPPDQDSSLSPVNLGGAEFIGSLVDLKCIISSLSLLGPNFAPRVSKKRIATLLIRLILPCEVPLAYPASSLIVSTSEG